MPEIQQELAPETPLLKPHQVEEMIGERERLVQLLDPTFAAQNPHIVAQLQDKRALQTQVAGISRQLTDQLPRAYEPDQLDAAIALEKQLLEEIREDGMPTHREMRRNPAGAVDKHLGHEARNKSKIRRWKNLRRRLYASGALPDSIGERDMANVETFRPYTTSHELAMDNEQIPGMTYHTQAGGPAAAVTVFSGEDLDTLRGINPNVAAQIALMSDKDRSWVRDVLDKIIGGESSVPKKKRVVSAPKADGRKAPKSSSYRELLQQASKLGIKTFGKKKDQIEALVQAALAAPAKA